MVETPEVDCARYYDCNLINRSSRLIWPFDPLWPCAVLPSEPYDAAGVVMLTVLPSA